MSLRGKTVLITGASRGIGAALALQLASEGSNLILVSRNEADLEKIAQEARGKGTNVRSIVGSVDDEAVADAAVGIAVSAFKKLDVLVCNAGIGAFGPTDSVTMEQWNSVFQTNVTGTFLFSRSALVPMRRAHHGHIVVVASDVARRTFSGGALYCASKHAQDAFASALRKEVRADGIRVTSVFTGLVDTDFHTSPQGSEEHKDWLKAEDVSEAIVYAISRREGVVVDELLIHPTSQDW